MKYVRGDRLPEHLRREVLAKYVHRWTNENARQTYGGRCPGCVQATRGGRIVTGVRRPGPGEAPLKEWAEQEWHAYHVPLTSDADWLAGHAFAVTAAGRLDERQDHAEPALMAESA